jgi:hypothetical protein
VIRKLIDLLHGFFDRLDVFFDLLESHFIVIDPARNFTVGKDGWLGEDRESQ